MTDITVGAIPWYKSPQELGLITTAVTVIITLFPKAGNAVGLTTSDDVAPMVQNIAGTIAFIVPIVLGIIRIRSKLQPLALTPSAAAVHPATLAAAQIQTLVDTHLGDPT